MKITDAIAQCRPVLARRAPIERDPVRELLAAALPMIAHSVVCGGAVPCRCSAAELVRRMRIEVMRGG